MPQEISEGTISHPIADVALSSIENRHLFNSKAPIAQLDYDVLANIFMLNTSLDIQHPHNPSRTTRRTSQVCRSWRNIAIECPILWGASLDFADPLRWMKEVISRAGSAPIMDIILPSLTPHLTSEEYINALLRTSLRNASSSSIPELLYFLASDNNSEDKLALAVSLLHRSTRVFIKIRKAKWIHIVENLSQASPTIHTFSLLLQGSQQFDLDFMLPVNLFDNQAPRLRVLDLRGCGCHFSSPIFRNLTTLVVWKPSSQQIPRAESWLEILIHMTELRKLELTRAFNLESALPADTFLVDSQPILDVSLPNLQVLTLVGNIEPCSTIFTHLQFPSSCVMNVRCYRTRVDDFFHSMISSLRSKMESLDRDFGRSCLKVACTTTGLGFTKRHLEGENMYERVFSFDWFSSHADPNILAIFPSVVSILKIACSDVPELRLDFNQSDALNNSRIVELLLLFQRVHKLYITMNDTLQRLLPVLITPSSTLQRSPLLPALRTVILEHALYGEDNHRPEADGLLTFVRERSDMGLGIKEVTFLHCGDVSKTAAKLEELGVTVVGTGQTTIHREQVETTELGGVS
ncbi:hypothetical protein BDZ97DRAFT_683489 [Flammula alnicola]|nr:hypothetical protein BDZ97DRAFT_683489 [Flammula alnicola]